MLTIYKYPLNSGGCVDFKEADIIIEALVDKWLYVGHDPNGEMCVWARVAVSSLSNLTDRWKVMIRGTGHNCDDTEHATYIGTTMDGPYVWHIFAVKE
jgi:hypothetical protein